MGKRAIRENIVATRALVQLPWLDVAKLYFDGSDRKLRMFKFVFLEWPEPKEMDLRREWHPKDEEYAEVIAIIGAPLSHATHIKRIADVTEKIAIRYVEGIHQHQYTKEEPREAEVRRARAAKAERIRIQRKLPRA